MLKTTAVSITIEEDVLDALAQLARDENTTVGKLVGGAVTQVHGKKLEPMLLFLRQRDHVNGQSTIVKGKK